ncbi:hypothetical protein [Streptomonospora litoralis]|uniref:Uncharacterized protein n=1 Tax=Streptomonospora litoralis TaxID=2498135 RepID=A0A4V0ZJD0_9ACTN|nr:hypothetical protein [Streptomonospora litoralis]QBI53052.1 hypothetical protein EKD16_06270 [Streptomonospora litoralis]
MSNEGESPTAGVVLARPDVSALRTKHGAWIGVGAGSFTVKGAAAYEVVSKLLGGSDGSRTGPQLVDDFPAGSRAAVSRVLDALVTHRCVTVLDAPMSHQVAVKGPASEWLLAYFAQLTTEPVRALDRVLATTLHLYGRPAWLSRLRGLLDAAPLFGLRTEFHTISDEDRVPQWEDADLVVVDADGLSYERTVRLQDELLERGVPHGIVGEVGGRRWIIWSDDRVTGCWDCLNRYARTTRSAAPAETAPTAPDDSAAAALIHAVYRRSAGLADHAAAAVSVSHESGLPTVKTHPAWAAAGCRCHRAVVPPVTGDERDDQGDEPVRRNIVSPEDDSRLDDVHERIIGTLAGWTDGFAGPFRYLDGGDLPQVPFGQAQATVLVGLAEKCRVRELTAAVLSSREALYQAALNALEMFAAQPGGPLPDIGAGWTLDEAVYRALLRRSMSWAVDDAEWVRLSEDDLGHGECAAFSRYIRHSVGRSRGGEAPQWIGTRLANGIYRVRGRAADGSLVAHGAGACYAEAVCTAMLALVNDADALVPLNPHFRTWAELWRHVARPECVEVTERTLPFARGEVRLVEVP